MTWLELGTKALDISGATADAQWREGESGFGYGDNDDVTQVAMRGKHTKLCTRIAFDLTEKPTGNTARLQIRYDDGFIAYLNGEEIARRSVEGIPGENLKVSSHEAGQTFEAVDLPTWARHARKGKNVLAIVGYNVSSNSSDLTLEAYLQATEHKEAIVAKRAKWSFFVGGKPDADWMTPGFKVPDPKSAPAPDKAINLRLHRRLLRSG